jgi:hypothetical protein
LEARITHNWSLKGWKEIQPFVQQDYFVMKFTGMTERTGTDISPVLSHLP